MSVNLLDLIPEKTIQSEEKPDGKITILKPKFRNKLVVKYVLPKLKNPNFKVYLDDFGSFVWKQIDGKSTVAQIGDELKNNFDKDVDPVYERLSVFVQSLFKYKFIHYKNYDPEKDEMIS